MKVGELDVKIMRHEKGFKAILSNTEWGWHGESRDDMTFTLTRIVNLVVKALLSDGFMYDPSRDGDIKVIRRELRAYAKKVEDEYLRSRQESQ